LQFSSIEPVVSVATLWTSEIAPAGSAHSEEAGVLAIVKLDGRPPFSSCLYLQINAGSTFERLCRRARYLASSDRAVLSGPQASATEILCARAIVDVALLHFRRDERAHLRQRSLPSTARRSLSHCFVAIVSLSVHGLRRISLMCRDE
jgi:hypothetical protein